MKVVLPLLSSASHISGVQRHAINAAASLLKSAEITQVCLIAGSWQQYVLSALPPGLLDDPRLKVEFASVANTVAGRNLWFYGTLPGLCNAQRAHIVHLAYPVPLRRSAFYAPVVVTLHDLYPYDSPGNFGFPKVLFNRKILLQCLRAADAIACVSESTLERLDGLEPRIALTKAVTVPNAVERSTVPPVLPPLLQADDQFLLCVGQHRRNKNVLLLLHTFAYLRGAGQIPQHTKLVVVGIEGPESPAIHRFVQDNYLQDAVVLTAGLSEAELQWCYQHCCVLVAPSTVEGFGLPVAEGALAGCRIVCSNIPAYREVLRNTYSYVPLLGFSVPKLAEAVLRAMAQPKPLPGNLPQLSLRHVSEQYIGLYRSLLERQRSRLGAHTLDTARLREREGLKHEPKTIS